MILAIETATDICSVAFEVGGEVLEERTKGRGVHSEQLFVMLSRLMEQTGTDPENLDRLLLSRGPGQYTGLRIGAAAVKGFLFGRSVSFHTLGTLEGFAAGVMTARPKTNCIHAVLDARRRHLYHQRFVKSGKEWIFGRPDIRELSEIGSGLKPGDRIVGTGIERLGNSSLEGVIVEEESFVSARSLLAAWKDPRFSRFWKKENPETFEPDYLTRRQTEA